MTTPFPSPSFSPCVDRTHHSVALCLNWKGGRLGFTRGSAQAVLWVLRVEEELAAEKACQCQLPRKHSCTASPCAQSESTVQAPCWIHTHTRSQSLHRSREKQGSVSTLVSTIHPCLLFLISIYIQNHVYPCFFKYSIISKRFI